jgi:hypothetical protein
VCISSDGLTTILHREIYIGSANAVFGFKQFLNNIVLPLARETTAASELRELEIVEVVLEAANLTIELLTSSLNEDVIVILHTEVYLINNLKKIDFKLHYREQGSGHLNTEFTIAAFIADKITVDISTKRSPQTKKLNIVGLDEAKRAKIVQFFLRKSKCAEMVYLCVDFVAHLCRKLNILVTAFKQIYSV